MTKISYFVSALTDKGKVREENQDAFSIDKNLNLFVVADGMGGVKNGELAAKYVADDLPKLFKEKILHIKEKNDESLVFAIEEIINEQNEIIRERLGNDTGTTVVLAFIYGNSAFVGHLGDSRAYLLHDRALIKLTSDHNIANLLVETGKITPEEARVHPMRHMLTKYMGSEGKIIPEINKIILQPGDRLLLCTDGLIEMVYENEIQKVLLEQRSMSRVLEILIDKANLNGGNDNITALLIDILNKGQNNYDF